MQCHNISYKHIGLQIRQQFGADRCAGQLLLNNSLMFVPCIIGGTVIEALRYKPEGRGIDFRWCHWNFSLT
jgi:hypothetical protein